MPSAAPDRYDFLTNINFLLTKRKDSSYLDLIKFKDSYYLTELSIVQ